MVDNVCIISFMLAVLEGKTGEQMIFICSYSHTASSSTASNISQHPSVSSCMTTTSVVNRKRN